jgi:hypothetical protein
MDIAGLVVAVLALIISVGGILDVRKQVREMLAMQRDLTFAKLSREMVWRFLDPVEMESQEYKKYEVHEYIMLARKLEPHLTLDSLQEAAYKEILSMAKDMVGRGIATWKPDIDENVVQTMVNDWQLSKNSEKVKSMFEPPEPWWRFGF